MTNEEFTRLEQLIDSDGLQVVLSEIARICFEKAEHVETNWQDLDMAVAWDDAGSVVTSAAVRKAVNNIQALALRGKAATL